MDFYNGPGSFARWPAARRDAFLDDQRARGDLWDVLFDAPITAGALASVTMPVHVVGRDRQRPSWTVPSARCCWGTCGASSTASSREPAT